MLRVEALAAALLTEGLLVTSAVIRPDGAGELEIARTAKDGAVFTQRYYTDLQGHPTRRTAQHIRHRLDRARKKVQDIT